jgi:hypothetical protein
MYTAYTQSNNGGVAASAQTNITVNAPQTTQQVPTNPAPPVSLTGVEGYNPSTNIYTNGTALINTYLVLYGAFGASGNTVISDGSALPASAVTYQSPSQINVSLAGLDIVPGNGHSISVITPSGSTNTLLFTLIAPATIATPTNSQPSASLNLSATRPGAGAVSSPYRPGDSFSLAVSSNQLSASFSLCSNLTGNPSGSNHTNQCAANFGTTDANGNDTFTGTWDSSVVGTWTEWVQFGSYQSPPISFTVTNP